jgi:hypothetical protein
MILSAQDDEQNKVMDGDHIPDPTAPGGPKALWAMGCSCGYGNTVELRDGSLLSVYSWTNATQTFYHEPMELGVYLGVVKWRLPPTN